MTDVQRYRDGLRRRITSQRRTPESEWFWDHYEGAAGQIIEVCESSGITLEGRDVADIGCGDGIMALGVCHRARPRKLTAFDIVPTNADVLLARSSAEGIGKELPVALEFRESSPTATPAEDESFDFVYSWSAFEHIADPIGVLTEIRRIIRPSGVFFLQLWPFYNSAKGSHLWDWFEQDFHHLVMGEREIVEQMGDSDRHSKEWTEYMTREFEHLNRITLDELQRAVIVSGFDVRRLELLSSPTLLTPELARYAWADLAIGGIKLLAAPRL
jgi:ubiquinone/menaquinone biosynthesis C-methylase UbiE